jgi:hypothetical protein
MAAHFDFAGFQQLSHLFFNIKLVDVIDYIPPPEPVISHSYPLRPLKDVDYGKTPGKLILDAIDDSEKIFLLEDFKTDDKIIDELNKHIDKDDPDFIRKKNHNNIGFFMEDFIVKNGTCPICKTHSLRKHIIHNMPAVDLLCINNTHPSNYSILFQVKTSVSNDYFTHNIIPVGSRYFGQYIHSLTPIHPHKNISINYICIDLVKISEISYEITDSSYILLPQLDSVINESFYAYTDPAHITYNYNNVSKINCSHLFSTRTVNRTPFSYVTLDNPFSDLLDKGVLKLKFNGGFYYKLNKYIHKLNIIQN